MDGSITPLGDISPFDFLDGLGYRDFSKRFFLSNPLNPNPDVVEHTAFPLHWLCSFVFYVPELKVTFQYLPLANCLAHHKMALAPSVLGALYRGLFLLVDVGISVNCDTYFVFSGMVICLYSNYQ